MNLKSQKELLLKQINKEIRKVPAHTKIYLKIPKERKHYSEKFWEKYCDVLFCDVMERKEKIEKAKKEKTQVNFNKTTFVIFQIDSGTQYKIVRSKDALITFKKVITDNFQVSDKKTVKRPYIIDTKPKGLRPTLNVTHNHELDFEYIRPYKPCRISNNNFQLTTTNSFGINNTGYKLRQCKGWFSNGHYIIKGKLPDRLDKAIGGFRDNIKKKFIEQQINDSFFLKAEIKLEAHKAGTLKYLVLIQRDTFKITLDIMYCDLILHYCPNAIPFINPNQNDTVLFKVDKKVVAICMRCVY